MTGTDHDILMDLSGRLGRVEGELIALRREMEKSDHRTDALMSRLTELTEAKDLRVGRERGFVLVGTAAVTVISIFGAAIVTFVARFFDRGG